MRKNFSTKKLHIFQNKKPIIENLQLSIQRGSLVSVMGPNGSGKTTFLRTLAGFHKEYKGSWGWVGEKSENQKESSNPHINRENDEKRIKNNKKLSPPIAYLAQNFSGQRSFPLVVEEVIRMALPHNTFLENVTTFVRRFFKIHLNPDIYDRNYIIKKFPAEVHEGDFNGDGFGLFGVNIADNLQDVYSFSSKGGHAVVSSEKSSFISHFPEIQTPKDGAKSTKSLLHTPEEEGGLKSKICNEDGSDAIMDGGNFFENDCDDDLRPAPPTKIQNTEFPKPFNTKDRDEKCSFGFWTGGLLYAKKILLAGIWRKSKIFQDSAIKGNLFEINSSDFFIQQISNFLGLAPLLKKPIATLSVGQFQKILWARLWIFVHYHNPRIILMDEPFAGLDEGGIEKCFALLSQWRQEGRIVFLSQHNRQRALDHFPHTLLLTPKKHYWGKSCDVLCPIRWRAVHDQALHPSCC